MNKIELHKANLWEKLDEVIDWKISTEDKKLLPKYCREYVSGRITNRIGSNPEANVLRNLYFLKFGLENIKDQTKEGIEVFFDKLMSDKLKGQNNKIVAMRSKKAIMKNLSVFFSWKLGDKAYDLCKVLDVKIREKKSDIDTISPEDFNKLLSGLPMKKEDGKEVDIFPERRFLLMVLYSAGMRAEEFHNIRWCDITMPEGEDIFLKIRLRGEFSKTKGRTIQVYDKSLLPIARAFFSARKKEGMKSNDPIYKLGYDGNRKWMRKLGKETIGKSVYYHLFRHSAATNLASKLNRQQLCVYFGWDFSSHMPDDYIQRAGVDMDDVNKKMKNTTMEEMEIEFEGKMKALKEDFEKEKKTLKKDIAAEIRQQLLKEIANMESKATEVFKKPVSYKKEGDELISTISE